MIDTDRFIDINIRIKDVDQLIANIETIEFALKDIVKKFGVKGSFKDVTYRTGFIDITHKQIREGSNR